LKTDSFVLGNQLLFPSAILSKGKKEEGEKKKKRGTQESPGEEENSAAYSYEDREA